MIRRPTSEWKDAPKFKGRAIAQSLPLSGFQGAVIDALEHVKGHAKHSGRSAVFHLGRAWAIKEIDPEMAAFRCVTSEEEAATAIFRSVQRLKYPRALELKERDHTHKNALRILFDVVKKAIRESPVPAELQPSIYFDSPGARPVIHVKAPSDIKVNGQRAIILPQPPLNFQAIGHDRKPYDFAHEVQAIMSAANIRQMKSELQHRANFRNQLLYAQPNGVPILDPENLPTIITEYQESTFVALAFLELIDPYAEHQLFVTQCIDTFLKMLSAVGEIVPQVDREAVD